MLNQILNKFSKLLALWVILSAGVGFFVPQYLVPFKTYTDWFFAFTMFGIGCLLENNDFVLILKKPHLVFLGTMAQFTIMPFLAFIILKFFHLPPALAVGIILAACVPDAMASGVISYLAEADVALSVALTTSTTLFSPLLTPSLTWLLSRTYISIELLAMTKSILTMVILPLIFGLYAKKSFPNLCQKFKPLFPAISTLFIAFICGLVVALNRDTLGKINASLFAAVISLNILGLYFGYLAGRLFNFTTAQRRTLAINVGMQNSGMGAVLAIKHICDEAAIPNAIFATWSVITAAMLAFLWNKKSTQLRQK